MEPSFPMSKWQMTTSYARLNREYGGSCDSSVCVLRKQWCSNTLNRGSHFVSFPSLFSRIFQCFSADQCWEDSYHHHNAHTSVRVPVGKASAFHLNYLLIQQRLTYMWRLPSYRNNSKSKGVPPPPPTQNQTQVKTSTCNLSCQVSSTKKTM